MGSNSVFTKYWADIYTQVCDVLLEPGGLQLGLLTPDQFYILAQEVLVDFYGKTDMVKTVFNIRILVGVSTYPEPDQMCEIEAALAGQTYLHRSSGFYLDNTNPAWPDQFDAPSMFREDSIPVSQVQLSPTPNVEGNSVAYTNVDLPLIAITSTPRDFDIAVSGSGFGVISGFSGNPYVEITSPGFGVIGDMVVSQGNLTAIAPVTPLDLSYILMLPPSFRIYLKYGILAKIFGSDSELKDMQKAYYCQARYAEGVNLASAILDGNYNEDTQ